MGSLIKAHCDCGLEREMFLGGGMRNFTTYCNFPSGANTSANNELRLPDCRRPSARRGNVLTL